MGFKEFVRGFSAYLSNDATLLTLFFQMCIGSAVTFSELFPPGVGLIVSITIANAMLLWLTPINTDIRYANYAEFLSHQMAGVNTGLFIWMSLLS